MTGEASGSQGFRIHRDLPRDRESKFVITEDDSVFVSRESENVAFPDFMEILSSAFDLDDENVLKIVEEKMDEGLIILGYFDPTLGEVDLHLPLQRTEYVQKRLAEITG